MAQNDADGNSLGKNFISLRRRLITLLKNMIGKICEFLGHKMLITADGKTLTACKWLHSDRELCDCDNHSSICRNSSEEESKIIDAAIVQISEYLAGKRQEFSLPLLLTGTDFRLRVWQELQKIPYGDTVTYKELATRIGAPKACRAAANACGANPFPILIPCHRVVASGGKTGGYTGGTDIKHALLQLESRMLLV